MLHWIAGAFGCFMGFFGVFTNMYILLVLMANKKTRSSNEWILLHLSWCGLAASFINLCFSSPSIFLEEWVASSVPLCNLVGACLLAAQLLIIWSICALSADRCAAIASPLRYNQLVTRRRIAVYFVTVWVVSLTIAITSFFISPAQNEGIIAENSALGGNQPSESNLTTEEIPRSSDYPGATSAHLSSSMFTKEESQSTLSDGLIIVFAPASDNQTNLGTDDVYVNTTPLSGSELRAPFEYRALLGVCLPKVYELSWSSVLWTCQWSLFILIIPMCTLLVCDLIVLSIARKQRHRIVMALYQITLSAQATVTRNKGTPPDLWLNRSVPARSRACRAVWEDLAALLSLQLPLILLLVLEAICKDHKAPEIVGLIVALTLYATPSFTALLYGIRARPLKTAYKSYLRKRLTNSTLQNEIQQRLSPVDGSPRPGSRAKSFRSSTPSPNSSPIQTPRRLSTNDLRPPPPIHLSLSASPSHDHLGRSHSSRQQQQENHQEFAGPARRVRSFLHLPTQLDMQEFWSGLRRPNRSPTIVITHEIRIKDGSNSTLFRNSQPSSPTAEQRL